MDERQKSAEDDAAIRNVIESWTAAVRRRDFPGILQNHSSDIVMFDVPPPLQSRGIEAYRKTWDLFFSWSSDPIPFDVIEMSITAGRDVAFVVATNALRYPRSQQGAGSLGLSPDGRPAQDRWTMDHYPRTSFGAGSGLRS